MPCGLPEQFLGFDQFASSSGYALVRFDQPFRRSGGRKGRSAHPQTNRDVRGSIVPVILVLLDIIGLLQGAGFRV